MSQIYAGRYTETTLTIDWSKSRSQYKVLGNGDNALILSTPGAGAHYTLELKQPAGGAAGTVTWPVTVLWSGGTAPTLTVTNSKTDFILFYWNGTNYIGYLIGLNY